MSDEKWEELKFKIKDSFGFIEDNKEEDIFTDDVGHEFKGEKETLLFKNPTGKFMVERTKRPIILEKKAHYHKGAGGTARMEFIVSEDETTTSLRAFLYEESNEEWKELDLKPGGFSF